MWGLNPALVETDSGLEWKGLGSGPLPALSSFIILGKSFNFCDASFPYLENGTSTSCFTGRLRGSNEIEEELACKV